jgi:L-2-hydroxyglutarate oxidase LhgO
MTADIYSAAARRARPVSQVDAIILGGGIVGLATGLALLGARPGARIAVLEKEASVGAHQTGHNSGVIHAGLYYRPGSLKARTCARGRELMTRFCEAHGVRYERCGKVVVATRDDEVPRLEELERRGRANGLTGIRRIDANELREREPHAAAVAALFVAETSIVDYGEVARAMAAELVRRGAEVRVRAEAIAIDRREASVIVRSTGGDVQGRMLVACAGLGSDRVARMAGLEPGVRIVPFRGEYWMLAPERTQLVKSLIYPVPDPEFPFLGVHFTRRIGGGIEAGPNAVLAMAREGYSRASFDPRDAIDIASWPGFWRMAGKHWRAGLEEQWRSLSRRAFAEACAALVPEVREEDLAPGGSGVRAQAIARDGALVDDFAIVEGERMVHVVNAPSPAATASLAIGEEIARRARWL